MRIEINKLDADLFLSLYTSVGWEPPCREQIEKAQPFYEKMGFEPRPCEWDGSGMFKMIRRL